MSWRQEEAAGCAALLSEVTTTITMCRSAATAACLQSQTVCDILLLLQRRSQELSTGPGIVLGEDCPGSYLSSHCNTVDAGIMK